MLTKFILDIFFETRKNHMIIKRIHLAFLQYRSHIY